MSQMPFYLQHHDSGLYLTCPTGQYENLPTLASLEYSAGQMWLWTDRQENGKLILSNATYSLLDCRQCPEGPAIKAKSYTNPPEPHFLFTPEEGEDGTLIIRNEDTKVLGVKEMFDQKMATLCQSDVDPESQFKWKVVSVEQGYKWTAMDSNKLPENAVCVGKTEAVNTDADVHVCRGQVNGKLHFGNVSGGKRQICYHCRIGPWQRDYHHCNHCCNRENCSLVDYSNEDNVKQVEREYFTVLCSGKEAKWVEYKHGSPPLPYTVDWSVFPTNAVVAGVASNENVVFIGRGAIDGHIVTGFFTPAYEDTKLLVFHDKKIHQIESFEMLVINKEEAEVPTETKTDWNSPLYFGEDNAAMKVDEKLSLLCVDDGSEHEWVEYEKNKLPNFAVIAGVFNDNIFFVGKGQLGGKYVPGIFLPRESLKFSEENPHMLYVIDKEDMKIHKLDKFEALVVKPAAFKLMGNREDDSENSLYTVQEINDENFDDNWKHIMNLVKVELLKGRIQLAKRRDIK